MSEDPEFGTFSIDFLCENMMAVKADKAEFDDYGFYSTDGKSAFFDDLSITVGEFTVVFVEAKRSGDTLHHPHLLRRYLQNLFRQFRYQSHQHAR